MFEVGDKVLVSKYWLFKIDQEQLVDREFEVTKVLNKIVKVTRHDFSMLVQKQHVKKVKNNSYTKQKRKLKL